MTDTLHIRERHDFSAFILPGLNRLNDGLQENDNIRRMRSTLTPLIRHIERLYSISPYVSALVEKADSWDPLYRVPSWYLDSTKEWVLGLETVILRASASDILPSFRAMYKATLEAGNEALKDYDPELEIGRAYRFSLEQLSLDLDRLDLLLKQAAIAETGERVKEIAEHAAEAAGEVANSEISRYYKEYAEGERKRYWIWNVALVTSVTVSVALAWFIIKRASNTSLTGEELTRLVLILPIFAFAAYSSRQASFHRNSEATARLISVQLRTINAFTDSLDSATRLEMMRSLGQKIFSAGREPDLSDPEASYGLSAEILQWLQDRLRSNAKKEDNQK